MQPLLKIFLALSVPLLLLSCQQRKGDPGAASNLILTTAPMLAKTAKLDSSFFWKMMDHAFEKGGLNNQLREKTILDQLVQLTPDQIQQFEIVFQRMNQRASTWKCMAAASIMNGGASDDGFFYFRCWLISLGQKNFEATLTNPDHLASLNVPIDERCHCASAEFEALIYISDKAYETVTHKPSNDPSYPRPFAQSKGLFYDSGTKFEGEEWEEEDLPKIAPKLWKQFS